MACFDLNSPLWDELLLPLFFSGGSREWFLDSALLSLLSPPPKNPKMLHPPLFSDFFFLRFSFSSDSSPSPFCLDLARLSLLLRPRSFFFDYDLIDSLIDIIKVPITILGGAGSFQDIKNAVDKYGSIGISCGSLFVYKGPRKAVLLNYPKKDDKLKLIQT